MNWVTNCPNCGAIITSTKCEYCGTIFDRNGNTGVTASSFNADPVGRDLYEDEGRLAKRIWQPNIVYY